MSKGREGGGREIRKKGTKKVGGNNVQIACANCREVYELTMKEFRKINEAEPFYCSAKCLLAAMKSEYPGWGNTDHYRLARVKDEDRFGNTSIWSDKYNMTFRSRYDQAACDYVSGEGLIWSYEPFQFSVGTTIYIPDVYVENYDAFIELKGLWSSGQKNKLAEFRQQHPHIRLYLSTWLARKSWDND
jgi:hypothetical protein